MDADHHNVSKFSSPEDSNYIALRDVIRDCVRKCGPLGELYPRNLPVLSF